MRTLTLALTFLLLLLLTSMPYAQPVASDNTPVEVVLTSEQPPILTCEAPYEEPSELEPIIQQVKSMYRIDTPLAEQIVVAVSEQSAAYDMDPWLILALIKVESNGNPLARSKAGALGLMQLLPSTAEDIAVELGHEWNGEEQLLTVDINVRYGVHYLRKLLDRFDNMQAAIAAYNWGPNHIARRIRRDAELPSEYPIKVLAELSTKREDF